MPLPELEPLLDSIRAWALSRSMPVHEGIIELDDSYPKIAIVGFDAADVELFLAMAAALQHPVLVLNAPPLGDEDIRLAKGLADEIKVSADRVYYARVIKEAKAQLGRVHDLTAFAFASDLSRAVVFRASADWAEPLFGLLDRLADRE